MLLGALKPVKAHRHRRLHIGFTNEHGYGVR